MSGGARITLCRSVDQCVTGAGFVFTSIRVGGIERRVRDEATAQRHGIVGQETVGPAGFAMAARTIPHMVGYAREIDRLAPEAWIVNFTNPVGMVTRGDANGNATRDRHLRHADRAVRRGRARARTSRPAAAISTTSGSTTSAGCARSTATASRSCIGSGTTGSVWTLCTGCRCSIRRSSAELRLLPTEYLYYYDQPQRALRQRASCRADAAQADRGADGCAVRTPAASRAPTP